MIPSATFLDPRPTHRLHRYRCRSDAFDLRDVGRGRCPIASIANRVVSIEDGQVIAEYVPPLESGLPSQNLRST